MKSFDLILATRLSSLFSVNAGTPALALSVLTKLITSLSNVLIPLCTVGVLGVVGVTESVGTLIVCPGK